MGKEKITAAVAVLPEGVTLEMIEAWKKEHQADKLNTIAVAAPDGSKAIAILKPLRDRNVLALALSNASAKKIVEAGAVVFQNCKLFVDPRIEADDNMYVAACVMANQLNELPTVELGNL